jgi:hypothetical protein
MGRRCVPVTAAPLAVKVPARSTAQPPSGSFGAAFIAPVETWQKSRASANKGDIDRELSPGQRNEQKAATAVQIAPALNIVGELG